MPQVPALQPATAWTCAGVVSGHTTQSFVPVGPQCIASFRWSAGVCTQALMDSTHSSMVQLSSSVQSGMPTLWHAPVTQTWTPPQKPPYRAQSASDSQVPLGTQPLPTPQTVPLGHELSSGVFWQASVAARHVSTVHTKPSSQVGGGSWVQIPRWHVTVPLQKTPSSAQSLSVVQSPPIATDPSARPPSAPPSAGSASELELSEPQAATVMTVRQAPTSRAAGESQGREGKRPTDIRIAAMVAFSPGEPKSYWETVRSHER